jgi:hypothetical protein
VKYWDDYIYFLITSCKRFRLNIYIYIWFFFGQKDYNPYNKSKSIDSFELVFGPIKCISGFSHDTLRGTMVVFLGLHVVLKLPMNNNSNGHWSWDIRQFQYIFYSLIFLWRSPLWLHHKIGKKENPLRQSLNQPTMSVGGWFPYTVLLTICDEVPILIPGSYQVWLSNLAALLANRTISISKLWEVV